jgi:exonuclease SbcC
MRLKKIILNNIRSYENQEIEFQKGSTLLSGDIGAGKTSILLGIEFALFGLQPGQRGSALLKNGEEIGGVIIEFEIDGKQILIERTLKRKKTVSQDYCAITIDGIKKEISVMELKSSILELLKYPKEFSKKQNTLYKFTVYTPQEEMKQIILQDTETRTNTLRFVFGIDKYKKIIENTSILTSKLREEKRIKEGILSNVQDDKLKIIEKEIELEAKNSNLISLEKEYTLRSDERNKIEEEKTKISKKIEEKIKIQQEIEKNKLMISNKNDTIASNFIKIETLRSQIHELEKLEEEFETSKLLEIENQVTIKKRDKETFNGEIVEISSQINSLNLKNQQNQETKAKMQHIETCPTCLQDVDLMYKSNIFHKLDSEITENTRKIESLNSEKQILLEKIKHNDFEIQTFEKQIQELNSLKIKHQRIHEKESQLQEAEKSNEILKKEINVLNSDIETWNNSVVILSEFDKIFEEKQIELDESIKNERIVEIKVVELKKEIQFFTIQIQELKEKLEKTEEIRKELNYLIETENWLSGKFIPLISFIEKNIMVKLQSEFSKLFSEWFSMLVSDSFNVGLTSDFTPIIKHKDYEIEYSFLSGGERTAIALAYRLALNQVINSLLSDVKTKDLVILDEPTDGFSDKQLDKMRDVLFELNVGQLIIVSHEQKMEGFVDNVVKFKKENGISVIEA